MRRDFADWLRGQNYRPKTVADHLSQLARVERAHGDVDRHFDDDGLAALLDILRYSVEDERRGRPNPSLIPLDGVVLRTNLASYSNSVRRYRAFRQATARPLRPARPGAGA